jgi:large subunit ribosomal protein L10
MVADLKDEFENAEAIYLTEYSGLSANDMNTLRGAVDDAEARIMVVKNRLLKLALEGTDAEELIEHLTGPKAVVFCHGGAVAPAKAVTEFADEYGGIELVGGFAEGEVLDAEKAQFMATLPSREELLAQVVAGIGSPITGLVHTLNGVVSDFVFTLQAMAEENESAA